MSDKILEIEHQVVLILTSKEAAEDRASFFKKYPHPGQISVEVREVAK